ncbi:hypothetical protein, partial [Rodentibacter genomosp. 2]
MDKREYKTITIDDIEYVVPSFIDGRAGIIIPLGRDESGNLMFNYMGHKFKAIKQKTVTKTKPYFSKLEKALGFIFIVLIFVFSILVFIGKTNIGLVLS